MSWKNTLGYAGVGLLGGLVALGGGAIVFDEPQPVDLSGYAKSSQVSVLQSDIDDLGLAISDLSGNLDDLSEDWFSEDAWEAQAEIMALDELEDDNFEDLREWLISEYADDFHNDTDEDDIEEFKVKYRDVETLSSDHEDKDSVVERDLKVYYEDKNGDTVKRYITATVEIEDNDVEDLSFAETS
ncbi:MAG: hypothetical protein IH948_00030 [Bacteroidetes bacterium]|nr:hypothetical protein [Bacteroidota bacterium]